MTNHSLWFWAGMLMVFLPHGISLMRGLQRDDSASQLYATLIALVYLSASWWFVVAF
jgi:hypothetical protein